MFHSPSKLYQKAFSDPVNERHKLNRILTSRQDNLLILRLVLKGALISVINDAYNPMKNKERRTQALNETSTTPHAHRGVENPSTHALASYSECELTACAV